MISSIYHERNKIFWLIEEGLDQKIRSKYKGDPTKIHLEVVMGA
jgi:hypothetical protein